MLTAYMRKYRAQAAIENTIMVTVNNLLPKAD